MQALNQVKDLQKEQFQGDAGIRAPGKISKTAPEQRKIPFSQIPLCRSSVSDSRKVITLAESRERIGRKGYIDQAKS